MISNKASVNSLINNDVSFSYTNGILKGTWLSSMNYNNNPYFQTAIAYIWFNWPANTILNSVDGMSWCQRPAL